MTIQGQHFVNEYKKGNVLSDSMQLLYEKGHITKAEFIEVVGSEPIVQQIDICPEPTIEEKIALQEEYALNLDFRLCMLEMALEQIN